MQKSSERGRVRMRILVTGLILVTLAVAASNVPIISRGLSITAAVIASALVDLTNADRTANQLSTLTVSPALTAVAQMKANDMAAKGYFAHVSPEGLSPWHWFRQGGYTFIYAGENLAIDFTESVDVERAWLNSPKHRENILGAQFTEIGIAVATGTYQGKQTVFVAQMFGTPAEVVTASAPQPERPVRSIIEPKNPTVSALATTETPTAVVPIQVPVLGEAAGAVAQTNQTFINRLISRVRSWF